MTKIELPERQTDRDLILVELAQLQEHSQSVWDKEYGPYKAPELLPFFDLCRVKIVTSLVENGDSSSAFESLGTYKEWVGDNFSAALCYVVGFIDGIKTRNKSTKTAA